MADEYDQFFEDDDILLSSALDESLRHYNEVEVPLRSINLHQPGPSRTVKSNNSPAIVVDLCDSPKKCPPVQSRLSHFFKRPISDVICNKESTNEIVKDTDQLCLETENSQSILNNVGISNSSSPEIFYKESDADGFHISSGSHYVYPSNFPVREYQMSIIKTALFHNTLVSLPTGMGKTFIAAVVMYNFYRWYPMGKIVFMAPTRPLVAQQIEACHSIMGIPREMTFEMTGNIPPEQRYLAWNKYRVFFLTPQVLANDLSLNKCPSDMLRCIIVDEAHRATKDYAYVQVLRHLKEENRIARIVGLSATPGTTVEAVSEVVQNLSISKLEFRTDESPDVAKYTNKKDVECIPVKLTNAILHIRTQFLAVYEKYFRRLKEYRALNGNVTNLTKFQILGAKQKFVTSNIAREMPKSLVGCLINDFTVCMSLAYTLELLTIYGTKVFYLQALEISENHKCLSNDADLQKLLQSINRELDSQDLTWSHPKLFELKKIVQDYFSPKTNELNSKIIIFCQYRLVVVEVFELLKTFGSSVKPVMFVGQSSKEKGGLPQKKQLEVMSRFKSGDFNVLIATSVAEEGLDIGEVDLIICLEANNSPIKFVQRLGRTGRKRSGKCITLLTEGKEQMKYKSSVSSSKTLVAKMLKNKIILSKLAQEGPRLVPKNINPQRLMIHVKTPEKHLPEKKKNKSKKTKEENIMQYMEQNNEQVEEEEEGLNIFQTDKDKPKRKLKKRNFAELEITDANSRDVEFTNELNTDLNFDYNATDNLNVYENNVASVVGNDSDCWLAEEEAYNEWLQSCKHINTIAINDQFFKLLNLFTNCSMENNTCDNKLLKYNTDNELKNGKSNLDISFSGKKRSECTMDMNTIYANKHSLGIDNHLFQSSNNVQEIDNNRVIVHQTNNVSEESVSSKYVNGNVDTQGSDDLFISQKPDKPLNGNNVQIVTKQLNSIEINSIQNGPIVSSNRYKMKTVESTKDSKINFDDLFTQKANKFTEDTDKIADPITLRLSDEDGGEQSVQNGVLIIDNVRFNNDSPMDTIKSVERDENNDDSDYDNDMDFGDLFKSQMADTYIEKYNDKIMAVQINEDSNVPINDEPRSPVMHGNINQAETVNNKHEDSVGYMNKTSFGFSMKKQKANSSIGEDDDKILTEHINEDSSDSIVLVDYKPKSPERYEAQTIRHTHDNSSRYFKTQKPGTRDTVIDLSDDDSTVTVRKRTGSVDFGVLFEGRRANGYIEDYMDKLGKRPSKNAPTAVDDEDDDDIILLDHSPDFLNRKLPKKTVQTKLTDRLTGVSAPVCEVIDLLSPERERDHVAGSPTLPVRRLPTDGQAKSSNAAAGSSLFEDNEDDMDFMFVDYCSSGATGSQYITQIERSRSVDHGGRDDEVFTQKQRVDNVFTQGERKADRSLTADGFEEQVDDGETMAVHQLQLSPCTVGAISPPPWSSNGNRVTKTSTVKNASPSTAAKNASPVTAVKPMASVSYSRAFANNGLLQSLNTLKACQLFKPGFSLKRSTVAANPLKGREPVVKPQQPPVAAAKMSPAIRGERFEEEEDTSPLNVPGNRRRGPQFSQSTPKVTSVGGLLQSNRRRTQEAGLPPACNGLLTSSSSESDVFVNNAESTIRHCRVKKKRRPKPKKKLLFIDDEADVSNCGDLSANSVTNNLNSSSDEEDNDGKFDSSFIDDDQEESEETNMTKQYLQSVKSPVKARGVFKIPHLTRQHYNIDVYSQMDDRNDNSYEEDSFCVRDTSDLNTSSNTSAQQTSEERPSKPQKRKRIKSPQSTDSDESPDHFNRNMFRKRAKVKTSLHFS